MTESKPRILHINLARGWRGGEQQTWLLIKELAKRGYQQGLCAYPEGPIAAAIRELGGIEVISPSVCFFTPWRLQHWDIAHAHEGRGVYLAWWLKQTRHLRYIITRRMQQPPKSRFLTRQAYTNADTLVGISKAACRGLQGFLPNRPVIRIPSSHSDHLPDPALVLQIREDLGVGSGQTLIGHAGALVDAHKGQKLLIDAARALLQRGYQFQLIFMGDGPDRNELKAYASGLPCVRFLGQIDDIAEHISALDIFAFPSRHEGLGSVLIDVMAAGVPIIATNVGGIPDLIKDKRTGLLIAPNDLDELIESLVSFLDDRVKTYQMKKNAMDIARSLSINKTAQKYEKVYKL